MIQTFWVLGVTVWVCTLVVEVGKGMEVVAAGHLWVY